MRVMAGADLLVRSDFAHRRAHELARATGLSTTEVVEAALRAYEPPVGEEDLPPGLVREGRFLVLTGGPRLTNEDVLAAIDEAREERAQAIWDCT